MDSFSLIVVGICVLLLLLLLTIGALLYVSGLVSPIDVGAGSPPISKAVVAYKFARGSYKNAGDLFNEVTKHAPEYQCLGIYYDDPQKIPEGKRRYACGAILSDAGVKVEQEVMDRMKDAGFGIITLPEVTNCVKTTFPYISTLSIPIAVWRVYPRLTRYIQEHKLCAYPFLEIYDSSSIQFMAPLAKQEEFFVPETKTDIPSEYGDDSLEDHSDGSPSFYSDSPSSSASRSVSRFSCNNSLLCGVQDDSDIEENLRHKSLSLQNEEVTSSVDVRPSKARTNLLEEDEDEENKEGDVSSDEDQVSPVNTDSAKGDDSGLNLLQDSGICSGRTSAVPSEISASLDSGKLAETGGDDSASSFEEIH